jgi:hypothetical protein
VTLFQLWSYPLYELTKTEFSAREIPGILGKMNRMPLRIDCQRLMFVDGEKFEILPPKNFLQDCTNTFSDKVIPNIGTQSRN